MKQQAFQVDEVADLLGVSPYALYAAIRRGDTPQVFRSNHTTQ